MINLTQYVLVLLFVASTFGQKVIECTDNAVTIKWRPKLTWVEKLDLSKARLGSCPPSSLSVEEDVLLFSVLLSDCGFRRLVSEDKVTYTNVLTYSFYPELFSITERVECVHNISSNAAIMENLKKDLVFNLELMNINEDNGELRMVAQRYPCSFKQFVGDFNGPAPSNTFLVGTRIPIRARVEHQGPNYVWIYLQRCILSNTPDLAQASQLHRLISDGGCLAESKEGNATFLPRREPSEIRLYFQAFRFALGEQVFLYCDMSTWDRQSFNVDKKACQYLKDQNRWELLDDPAQSYICSCCDSTCIHRTTFESGMDSQQVLGPLTMVDFQPSEADHAIDTNQFLGSLTTIASPPRASVPGGFPVWILALAVCLVLILSAGVVATSYYLCFWRGGRLGYRPSRELLNKY